MSINSSEGDQLARPWSFDGGEPLRPSPAVRNDSKLALTGLGKKKTLLQKKDTFHFVKKDTFGGVFFVSRMS
jgi:hypothetical protein